MSRRHELIAAARAAKGTPWVHQGRHPGLALDCVGLVIAAAKGAGIDTSEYERDIPNYGTLPALRGLLKFFQSHLEPIGQSAVQVGDIGLIKVHSFPMHCGILTDFGEHGGLGAPFGVIHTWTQVGYVTEHSTKLSGAGFHSFWRVPGIDD